MDLYLHLLHCTKNAQETGDLVTFTEEILKGKLYFLCSASSSSSKRATKSKIQSLFDIMKCIDTSKIFLASIFYVFRCFIKAFSRTCNATYCTVSKRTMLLVVPWLYTFNETVSKNFLSSVVVEYRKLLKYSVPFV